MTNRCFRLLPEKLFMQSNDARTLLSCAVPTAVVGVVTVAVSAVLAGGKGALGAAFGAILVAAVMTVDLIILERVAKHLPQLFQMMGLALYTVQFLLIAVVLAVFKDTTLFSTRAFACSLLAATLTWIAAQTRAHLKAKILYVRPEAEDERKPEGAKKGTPAGSPS
jgi:ATP synthase protein I